MTAAASSSSAADLARRLDRVVARLRAGVVLDLLGSGAAAAAAAAAVAAGIDRWLRPESLWLGGSFVWAAAAAALCWRARCRLPAGWPTRLSVAAEWEKADPAVGTRISAAVGFLADRRSSAPPEPADAFKQLAIDEADRTADRLAGPRSPAAGPRAAVAGLAAVAALLASGFFGTADWRRGLIRQLPPAVGGWPAAGGLPETARTERLSPLRPAEIPAASRRLIRRVDRLGQVSAAAVLAEELVATTRLARELADRLPPAAPAGVIRWVAAGLTAVEAGGAQRDQLADLAAGGDAAVRLAAAAGVERRLADELAQLFARQPGLRSAELPPDAVRQLGRLASVQRDVGSAFASATTVLEATALLRPPPDPPSTDLPSEILDNRLGLAAGAAGAAARAMADAVLRLGLDVPTDGIGIGGDGAGDLSRAVVELAAVAAELDLDRRRTAASAADSVAVAGGAALPPRAAGAAVAVAGQPGSEPAAAGGGQGGSQAVPPPGPPPESEPGGPVWRLDVPERRSPARVAADRTQVDATAEAFADYLELLLPPPSAAANAARQPAP